MDDEMARVRGATADERLGMRVQVLGPLSVEHDGRPVHIAGTQRRRLLAFLASRPRQASSVDAIVDVLWPDDPPPSAAKTVQSHVVRLRRSLAGLGELLVTVPGGYRLDVNPAAVDAFRFEELVADGRRQLEHGHPTSARASLAEALGLWRGPAYADAVGATFVDAETVRLDELRRSAVEDLAEADLVAGAAAAAVPELERLVTAEPGRERAWALLMRSLYASGRQRDALVAFERARRALAESYGLEPGPALREVQRQVLQHDPDLDVGASDVGLPVTLRTTTPLVGRQSELARLSEAWSVARAGTGQVRLVVGPAGSGRTRLAAALAAAVVAEGGAVEYGRGADGLDALVTVGAVAGAEPAGRVVDAVVDRCRRRPVLLVVDDAEWMPATAVLAVEALADVAAQLSLLLVLILDQRTGGPAVEVLRRIERASGSAIELPPMDDASLGAILQVDGADDDATAAALAVADGLPGVARREAAAWMERAAGDRLERAAASSLAAASVADDAHATVFDEVLGLVAARAHRDALVSSTWAGRQPYRSLAPYGPEDADLFVGRERLVAELAARVLDRRLVAVVAASGSGKSSLVRAGLVPLVRSGRLPGTAPWRTNVIVPGTDPMAALDSIDQVDEPGPQLLVVDQFEEIATTGAGSAFGSRLLDLVLDAALDVHVVLVVRADQYGTLASSRHLTELIEDAQVIVGPPSEEELRRIVTEPARRTGCAVDPALVDLVVADVAGQDGILPLASAALAEVWERRSGETLSAEQYVAIGGLAAAVERLGERALVMADDEDGVRDVLLRLVDVTDDGQWVRRRVAAADLPDRLAGSVDALVTARLAISDGGVLDVVHEVVFRSWPRLAGWLDDARTDLVIDRDLRVAARSWDDQGRSDDDVYRGARLHAAAEWLVRHPDASPTVIAFVGASKRAAAQEHEAIVRRLAAEVRSRRRLSRALAAAGVLLVGALVAGGLAVIGQRRADDARREAVASAAAENASREVAEDAEARAEEGQRLAEQERDLAESARLVAETQRALDDEIDLAMLLAVEARRRLDTPETRTALLDVLRYNLPRIDPFDPDAGPAPLTFTGFMDGPTMVSPTSDIDISSDGRVLAASGAAGTFISGVALVYDTSTRTEIGRISDDEQRMQSVDVSDDGRFVLATTSDRVHVFDVEGAAWSTSSFRAGPDTSITSASFSPSGDQYVVTTAAAVITLWDRSTDSRVDVPLPPTTTDIAGFAPDGTLALGQANVEDPDDLRPRVQFWDVDQGVDRGTIDLAAPEDIPTQFTFSPDMRYLAGAADGSLVVWDLATGQILGGPAGRSVEASAAILTPISPSAVAIGRTDGGMQLHDVATDQPITDVVPGGGSTIVDLATSVTGDALVALTDQGVLVMWRDTAGSTPLVRTIDCCTSEPTWAVLGEHVLAETDSTFLVHDTRRPEDPGVVIDSPTGGTEVETIEISADGSVALVGAVDDDVPSAYLTDLTTGVQQPLPEVNGWVATLSADGTRIATIGTNGTLELWDVERLAKIAETTGAELGTGTEFTGPPHFTTDGSALDIATFDGVARLDADDLTIVSFAQTEPELLSRVVDDVPGTDDVIGIVSDGSLARFDQPTGDVVATNPGLQWPAIRDVEVGGAGAIGGLFDWFDDSPNVQLFDVATLRTIGSPLPIEFSGWTHFTEDGRYLADLLPGGRYRLWDVDADSWQASVCAVAGRNLTRQEWEEFIGPDEPYRVTCPDWPAG